MRLRFIPVIDILATIENHRSSQRGISFDEEYPVAFDSRPTTAVTAKWKPVKVVAGEAKHENRSNRDQSKANLDKMRNRKCILHMLKIFIESSSNQNPKLNL